MSQFIGEDSTQLAVNPLNGDSNTVDMIKRIEDQLKMLKGIESSSKKIKKIAVEKTPSGSKVSIKTTNGEKVLKSKTVKPVSKADDKKQARSIISVSYPTKLVTQDPKTKATHTVDIQYIGTDGKKHFKQVHFGDKSMKDYYETGDELARLRRVNSQRKSLNVLYPPFWNYLYLNHHSGNLKEAFMDILHTVGLDK